MFLQLSDSGVDVPAEFVSFIKDRFSGNMTFSSIYVQTANDEDKYKEVQVKNDFNSDNSGSEICLGAGDLTQDIINWLETL